MLKFPKALKALHRVVTLAGALLAAVVVALEAYRDFKKS